VKGTIVKRVKDAIVDLGPINPDLAKQANSILTLRLLELTNLTNEMSKCRFVFKAFLLFIYLLLIGLIYYLFIHLFYFNLINLFYFMYLLYVSLA
jgi:hypothetical protein